MTTARAPLVSVVLPVFDAAAHLRDAVDSILSQTLEDFELIVVDDGSRDATPAILRSYRDRRIRLLEQRQNTGLAATLNRALAVARGRYVARQDADDISEPHRLRTQVEYLRAHADVALVGSWFRVIDARGALVRRTVLPVEDLDLRWAMFFSCPFVHSAVMWRREAVEQQVGRYDERFSYSLDYDFWTRIAARYPVANVPHFLVRWRVHAGSMTATCGARTLEGHRLRVDRVAAALGWSEAGEAREARFRALSALLRPSHAMALSAGEARRGRDDLLELQERLCRQWSTRPEAARRHRRAVRAAIGAGLLRACRRCIEQRRERDACRLLVLACSTHWSAVRVAARMAVRLLRAPVAATP